MGQRVEAAELPVVFRRPMRLHAYVLGHSRLVLRGPQDPEEGRTTTVDVEFADLGSMSVRDYYPSLTIRFADAEEEARLRAADPREWHDWRAFVLETEDGANGHVVAGGLHWGESAAPETYDSFLLPWVELSRFRPEAPAPAEPAVVHSAWPPR
ncbi:hypothetical protein ACFY7C_28515 [Streptomyces sp. NPDC012769]|uniref:hypothetical protein n=1 Tax=Streptomyces sp. NPDC012769 TaxID=3364848 RepID=UPI0036B16F55